MNVEADLFRRTYLGRPKGPPLQGVAAGFCSSLSRFCKTRTDAPI